MSRCFYFGCWNQPGHYIRSADSRHVSHDVRRRVESYRVEGHAMDLHLDGTLAPRRNCDGKICWEGQGETAQDRSRIHSNSSECAQGEYLLHTLSNGFTAIQWWDRCQGDERGACNSTVLLEGAHTADEMVAALEQHFPSVLANLKKHGVELVNVTLKLDE